MKYRIDIIIRENGSGFFALKLGHKTIGQIKVSLVGNELILLDTIVLIKSSLHTIGVLLLQEVVEYARMHELKIITISKFVQKQFSSNPALYADVWEKA